MKKICLFLPSLRGGGAERVMTTLAVSFTNHGCDVDLVLAEAVGPYMAQIPKSINIIDLESGRVLFSLPKLVSYLKKQKPNALLSTMPHANVVALWAAKMSSFNGNVVIRQANMMTDVKGRNNSLKEKISGFLLKKGAASASAVVVLNKSMGAEFTELTGLHKNRLKIINNPVDFISIRNQAQERVYHPWLEDLDIPIIISVGRLTAQKNFSFLLNAFAKVQQHIKARLLILGEGELRDDLTLQVAELGLENSVQLLGFQSNPYAYLSRSTLFVLPSRWEGFPNALVEAMACGMPVIATDCPGGSKEILGNGRWGRVVPVDNVNALSSAISKTLVQTTFPNVLERVSDFSVDKISDKYLKVLLNEEADSA